MMAAVIQDLQVLLRVLLAQDIQEDLLQVVPIKEALAAAQVIVDHHLPVVRPEAAVIQALRVVRPGVVPQVRILHLPAVVHQADHTQEEVVAVAAEAVAVVVAEQDADNNGK